jgi:hypothetical protein
VILFFRVIFRIAVGVLFVVLSILTLRSPYAPVQPYGLPLIGIVLGIVLVLLGLWQIRSVFRATAIAVDSQAREVRRQLEMTSDVEERYSFDEYPGGCRDPDHAAETSRPGCNRTRPFTRPGCTLLLHDVRQEVGKHSRGQPEDAYVTIGHRSTQRKAHWLTPTTSRASGSAEPQLLYRKATTPA